MPAEKLTEWMETWKLDTHWHHLTEEIKNLTELYDLNVAIFTVRLWMDQLQAYLESDQPTDLPTLDANHCQFSLWYQGIGLIRYGEHSMYANVRDKHYALHHLAEELIDLSRDKQLEQARSRLPEVLILGEELVTLLKQLSDSE